MPLGVPSRRLFSLHQQQAVEEQQMNKIKGVFLVCLLATASPIVLTTNSNAEVLLHSTGEGLHQGDLDPNWTVTLPNGSTFGNAISATDPHDLWRTPTPPNTWISVVARGDAPEGLYKYSTTFTIPAEIDPTTVQVTGNWWADEAEDINAIYLNGVKVSDLNGTAWYDPSKIDAFFSIQSGFQSGLNTLEFTVLNTSGPGGTLIEFPGVVPEPSSIALLVLGALTMGLHAVRTKRQLGRPDRSSFDHLKA
jgi:hypothetical protein